MAKNCTYSFSGPDGRRTVLKGEAAIKAWLVAGGLEYLRGAANDALASRARDITDTPEFKKWFGASKVVDAEGKPLVVYHGTARDFKKFDPLRVGKNWGRVGGDTFGLFFTTSTSEAEHNAKQSARRGGAPHVMPVYQ